jgi:hypothetical protein
MPTKIYRVTLTAEEREDLTALVNEGKGPASVGEHLNETRDSCEGPHLVVKG